MKYFLLISTIATLLFASCSKEQTCTDGLIRWGGEPAVDGLGWYFTSAELGERPVKLKTIPEKYLKDSLQVNVCLRKTDEKYQCFCAVPLEVYEIRSIRNR
jgi:hypothetical protein